jgi:hypothetical protein
MAGIGQALNKMFFWSYERGSWQYDVAVALIVAFVFTPKSWFHDQPQVGLPVNPALVERIEKSGETEIYKVDSRVLAPPERTPSLQNALHNVLQKAGPGLSDGRFAIGKIEALRDEQGNVIAYQVEIKH